MNEGPLCLDCVEKPRFGRVIGTIAAGGEAYGESQGVLGECPSLRWRLWGCNACFAPACRTPQATGSSRDRPKSQLSVVSLPGVEPTSDRALAEWAYGAVQVAGSHTSARDWIPSKRRESSAQFDPDRPTSLRSRSRPRSPRGRAIGLRRCQR
jgi:hypothetical protein